MASLPIIELLKQNFRIAPSDTDADIQVKILHGTEALGADVAATVPYLLRLLAVENDSTKTGTANRTEAAAYALRHGLRAE